MENCLGRLGCLGRAATGGAAHSALNDCALMAAVADHVNALADRCPVEAGLLSVVLEDHRPLDLILLCRARALAFCWRPVSTDWVSGS